MALTTLNALKISMGIPLTNTSMDTQLTAFVAAADAAVKKWCKRDLESTTYSADYYSGNNRPDLVLRQRPVTTLTSIWVDAAGFWGQGANAFASNTLQTVGRDYALIKDAPGGAASLSGIVRRVGTTGLVGFMGGIVYPSGLRQGTLSGWDRGTVWPAGDGNIKVSYTAGYLTVPSDLQEATNMIAKQLKAMQGTGMPMASENYVDYAYALLTDPKSPIASVRSILAQYAERPI